MFADVTSANVVGYANSSLTDGTNVTTPMFYKVGGGAVDVQDIIPSDNAPDGGNVSSQLSFQILDKDALIVGNLTYYWHNRDVQLPFPLPSYTLKGWYTKATPTSATDGKAVLTINPGEAVYLKCPIEGVTLGYSGEVKTSELNISVNNGRTLVGNPFPVNYSIQNITPIGENVPDGGQTTMQIQFQRLAKDSTVRDNVTYYWHNRDVQLPFPLPSYSLNGWYTKATPTSATDGKATLELLPGEGVYVNCPVDGISFNFAGLDL